MNKNKGIRLLISDEPVRKIKTGPAIGSGKKKARLTIRCSEDLISVLNYLQKDSWFCTGMSHSALVHKAIKELALYQFVDASELLNRTITRL
jgi:hypothetical protein